MPQLIVRGTEDYPSSLDDLSSPPRQLYALGAVQALTLSPGRLVAIVGTRDASPYGMQVAGDLARAFVRAGVGVVSGMARGIDRAAHEAALEAGGTTIAVLGTGVDVPYPASHRALHARIAAEGLVLSENEPGTTAYQGAFPRRNRLVAALASALIVVEAPFKSGAINSANHALELGREVGAIPGQIGSPRCAGSNQLLRDGAHVLASVDDALALMGLSPERSVPTPKLDYEALRVWEALATGPSSADGLSVRLGMSIRQVLELSSELELKGLVSSGGDGTLRRSSVGARGAVLGTEERATVGAPSVDADRLGLSVEVKYRHSDSSD